MEPWTYREWTLGPLFVGFESEWRIGGDKTLFLIGCGFADGGLGFGFVVLGLALTVGVRRHKPVPVESLGREHAP